MTFLPNFYKDEKRKIVFADVAGLQDTDGNLIDFINGFVIRSLFACSKSVKILTTLTKAHIMNSRGQHVREQMQIIRCMCCHQDIEMAPIKVLMTRCKCRDDDHDIEGYRGTM